MDTYALNTPVDAVIDYNDILVRHTETEELVREKDYRLPDLLSQIASLEEQKANLDVQIAAIEAVIVEHKKEADKVTTATNKPK